MHNILGNEDLLNFIYSIDPNFKKDYTPIIKNTINEKLIEFIPNKNTEESEDIKKLFRFRKNFCCYEYGCIRLDFSKEFAEYTSKLIPTFEFEQ